MSGDTAGNDRLAWGAANGFRQLALEFFPFGEFCVGNQLTRAADAISVAIDKQDGNMSRGLHSTEVAGDFAAMRWKAAEINEKYIGWGLANRAKVGLFAVA